MHSSVSFTETNTPHTSQLYYKSLWHCVFILITQYTDALLLSSSILSQKAPEDMLEYCLSTKSIFMVCRGVIECKGFGMRKGKHLNTYSNLNNWLFSAECFWEHDASNSTLIFFRKIMKGKLDKIVISYNVSLYVPLITFQLSWNYSVIELQIYNNFYHENYQIIII